MVAPSWLDLPLAAPSGSTERLQPALSPDMWPAQLEAIQSRLLDVGSAVATPLHSSSEHKLQVGALPACHLFFLWLRQEDVGLASAWGARCSAEILLCAAAPAGLLASLGGAHQFAWPLRLPCTAVASRGP